PGIFHGGVVSALLDTTATGAVMAGHDFAKGSRLTTISLSVQYLSVAPGGAHGTTPDAVPAPSAPPRGPPVDRSGAVHAGVRQPPGGRGAVHLGQPGDEFPRLDGPAGLAPVFTSGPPAAQPLHPVAVHPEHLPGQPGRGV